MTKPLNSKRTINAKNYLRGKMSVLQHVKDNKIVFFVSFSNGIFTYETESGVEFEIPLEEVKNMVLRREEKAVYFIEWLKRKLEKNNST